MKENSNRKVGINIVFSIVIGCFAASCESKKTKADLPQPLQGEDSSNDLKRPSDSGYSQHTPQEEKNEITKITDITGHLSEEIISFTGEAMSIVNTAVQYEQVEESGASAYRKNNPDCDYDDPGMAEARRKAVRDSGLDPSKNSEHFAEIALAAYIEKSIAYLSSDFRYDEVRKSFQKLRKSDDFSTIALFLFFESELEPLMASRGVIVPEAQIVYGKTLIASHIGRARSHAEKWNLGLQLVAGFGCLRDESKGIECLEEVASSYDKFTYGLSEYYRDGTADLIVLDRFCLNVDFPKDMSKGTALLLQSLEKGYDDSFEYIRHLSMQQSALMIKELESSASPAAPYLLTGIYLRDETKDMQKANRYFRVATENVRNKLIDLDRGRMDSINSKLGK